MEVKVDIVISYDSEEEEHSLGSISTRSLIRKSADRERLSDDELENKQLLGRIYDTSPNDLLREGVIAVYQRQSCSNLMATSQSISTEASLACAALDSVLRESLYGCSKTDKVTRLLDICDHSRVVVASDSPLGHVFLNALSDKRRDTVRSLTLTSYPLAADDYGNRDAWDKLGSATQVAKERRVDFRYSPK